MILSIDLSPIVDRWIQIEKKLEQNHDFRSHTGGMYPSGEGINLSMVLKTLGEDSVVTGFAGGVYGDYIRKFLLEEGIEDMLVKTAEEGTERIRLNFRGREIEILHNRPRITREELATFYKNLKEGLNNCEIVCLSGEKPFNMPEDMNAKIISMSKDWGRTVMVSVEESLVTQAVKSSPDVLMTDVEGLEKLTNLKLEYEGEIIRATRYIFDNNIGYAIIDMEDKGLLILDSTKGVSLQLSGGYKGISDIGHGKVLGGFATGILRGYDLETTAKLSYACGIVEMNGRMPEMTDIKAVMNNILARGFHNI